jgi:hypothetical protein
MYLLLQVSSRASPAVFVCSRLMRHITLTDLNVHQNRTRVEYLGILVRTQSNGDWYSQNSEWASGWTTGAVFLLPTASRPDLGPTQPPAQRVPGAFSSGIKRPGREAGHSPLSTAKVKNAWSYTSSPQYVVMA